MLKIESASVFPKMLKLAGKRNHRTLFRDWID